MLLLLKKQIRFADKENFFTINMSEISPNVNKYYHFQYFNIDNSDNFDLYFLSSYKPQ